MATVGLTLKRAFNEAHNHLQNTVLPLSVPSVSELPSIHNMPSPVGILQSIKRISLPDYTQGANTLRDEVKTFLEHLKHTILLPLSWWLTLSHFILSLTWKLWVSARIISPRGLLTNRICVRPYRSGSPSVSMNAKSEVDFHGCLPSGERWPSCSRKASNYQPSPVSLPVRTRARGQPDPIFLTSTIPRFWTPS